MKAIIILILSISLLGCFNAMPKSIDAIESKVTIEHDSFKNQTWISTPQYLIGRKTDSFPVNINYRALYKDNKRLFIQIYVIKTGFSWGFYHSAHGEDGYKFDFVDIDDKVDFSGMVNTSEHFGLNVPLSYLEKMSRKDWGVKVYGKRNEGMFIVPQNLSKAFLNKLKCFESGGCNKN